MPGADEIQRSPTPLATSTTLSIVVGMIFLPVPLP
jgi:hypothetical protein